MKKIYSFLLAAAFTAGVANAADVVGEYTMQLQPTDLYGVMNQSPVSVNVEVTTDGETYILSEAGNGNYFQGLTVPFTYNSLTGKATFEFAYIEETTDSKFAEYPYLWSSPFVYGDFAEPQPMFQVNFNAENGFTFPEESGFAWFASASDEYMEPYDMYLGYYVLGCSKAESTPSVNYANPAIEGEWTITLNGHYIGQWSLGEISEVFTATLDGNVVTFLSSESQYNIKAEFTAENTLTFKPTVVYGEEAQFGTWQSPYVNTEGVDDLEELDEQVFTATYNPSTGTLTLPKDCGLRYGIFNNTTGDLSYWDDAFDLVAAQQATQTEAPAYGDESIEGTWNFSLDGKYQGDYSLGEFTELFTATLDGNVVTFESTGSAYNIKAEFTAANTLTFKAGLVGSSAATYGLWQYPYVNNADVKDIEDLTTLEFSATYFPQTGIIVFPENCGLRYGYVNNQTGELSYWDDAFDFLSASKSAQEEPDFGNPAIEGEWEITLNGNYLGEESLGEFTETFTATLEGNLVTFASSGSEYDIKGEFTGANIISFKKVLVGSSESLYGLWQSPYINMDGEDDIEDLTEQVFVAFFDAEAGEITFPEGCGLRYGYFSNETGELSYWSDAFDFVSAVRPSSVEPTPEGDIKGVMSASLDEDSQAAVSSWNVTASYAENALTVYNFAGMNPITLYVDPTTGGLSSALDVVAKVDGSVSYYYGDVESEELMVLGVVYNINESQCKIELSTWGIATVDGDAVDFVNAYFNTEIILDTYLEGVPTDKPSSIQAIGSEGSDEVVYYDLQGRKVKNPQGGIYIRKQGEKVTKVIINK